MTEKERAEKGATIGPGLQGLEKAAPLRTAQVAGPSMVPIFVADRPGHLDILAGLPLQQHPGAVIGIMANARASRRFRDLYRAYPCHRPAQCPAIGAPCRYLPDQSCCPVRAHVLAHTVKLSDSGAFTRQGAPLAYPDLYDAYTGMGAEYGIMIDVLGDRDATLESARVALQSYGGEYREAFRLVGVAQGRTLDEYLCCYDALKCLGYTHIAVGGLLEKRPHTARYVQVRDEAFLFRLLEELRARYPDDWLLALGAFHPRRMERFRELGVWADHKSWLFQYLPRQQAITEGLDALVRSLLCPRLSPRGRARRLK